MNFEQLGVLEASVEQLEYKKENQWINYPMGILWTMKKKGFSIEQGLDILYYGNIPNGSGLSSLRFNRGC
jgi:galactokinase